ncbi:MAG TPA: tail fiber domain-containing protein [Pyrinomonadaceae bacterium]|jgi:hypothetical protein|nr:tail fiber domain-containing protein [Pyrinomonadaceae bacterium]
MKPLLFLACLIVLLLPAIAFGQTTEFTYQGRLLSGGLPANGSHDFQFRLFDDPTGDTQVGPSITLTAVNVNNGVFSVRLDFGNQFPGANRFLEIRVKPSTDEFYTVLSPRQAITSSPYAIKSLSANNATASNDASRLGGVTANQYVLTTDSRLSDPRQPLPGSSNYIQTGDTQQPGNFSISGSGTVGGFLSGDRINANTEFQIGGRRVLRAVETNIFVGQKAGINNTTGISNSFFGYIAGSRSTGSKNSFFGIDAGEFNSSGNANSFFGASAGVRNQTGSFNTAIGFGADVSSVAGVGDLSNATAIGANAFVTQNNSLVLGGISGVNFATADTNVGIGTTAPSQRLHIKVNGGNILFGGAGCISGFGGIGFGATLSGCSNYSLLGDGTDTMINRPSGGSIYFRSGNSNQMTINPSGIVAINTLGSAGSTTLCRNSSNQFSTCSSSIRYKSNVNPFNSGLSLVKLLRPVSFTWKDGGMLDFGLVAEEVNKVEPLLTTTNEKGEVEGVKYDRLGVLLINAVKDQQSQIESQQKEIEAQQKQIQQQQEQVEALKRLVCAQNMQADVCKEDAPTVTAGTRKP